MQHDHLRTQLADFSSFYPLTGKLRVPYSCPVSATDNGKKDLYRIEMKASSAKENVTDYKIYTSDKDCAQILYMFYGAIVDKNGFTDKCLSDLKYMRNKAQKSDKEPLTMG